MEELRLACWDEGWHVITSDRRYWLPFTVPSLGLGIYGLGKRLKGLVGLGGVLRSSFVSWDWIYVALMGAMNIRRGPVR